MRNVCVERNEETRSFDCRVWYDDGWISSSVDFFLTDDEIAAAPNIEALVAERRGEAREKLKNAVVCLKRLLPRPEPERVWELSSSSVVVFSVSPGRFFCSSVSSNQTYGPTQVLGGQKIKFKMGLDKGNLK